MKSIPNHYKLIKEHPHSYEIHDGKDGRSFHVAKNGLNLGMHSKLAKVKKYSKGGDVTPNAGFQLGSAIHDALPSSEDLSKYLSVTPTGQIIGMAKGLAGTAPVNPEPNLPSAAPAEVPVIEEGISDPALKALDQSGRVKSLEQEKQTYEEANTAEKLAGQQKAQAYKNYSEDLENLINPLEIQEENRKKSDSLLDAYQKKDIDPNRVINGMSGGAKIGKILGLIFGGLGAGENGVNPGITLLNQEIERDIDAQKNSQTKSYNLYKMNREATQDDIQANLATREQMLLAVKAKALQYDAAASGPVAAAGRAKLIGEIDSQINKIHQDKALLEAASRDGLIGVDPSYFVNRISDPHQKQAAIKEINTMKQLKALKDGMLKAEEDLEKMFMAGLLSPNARKTAIGSFSGRAVKLGEGSFTKEQFEQFADNFFKNRTDWGSTVEKKAEYFDDFFKTLAEDSAFKAGTKVGLDKFAATSFKHNRKAQDRSEKMAYIKKNMNSKDPRIQKLIQDYIKKFGAPQ